MKELIAQSVHYDKFKGGKEIPKSLGENGDSQKKNIVKRNDERFDRREQAFEDAASISLQVRKAIALCFLSSLLQVCEVT